MPTQRCPGQDSRFWRPEDVSESPCPACGYSIEFFKDDPRRRCPECGTEAANPNFDAGCAAWCPSAEACLGQMRQGSGDQGNDGSRNQGAGNGT